MDYWNIVWMDFKKGDDSAFEKIYTNNIDILYRYGSKITSDKDLVKDCIQQLFLELFASRGNLANPENIEFYLLKALKRIIIRRINKDQKFNDFAEYELPPFNIEFDFDKFVTTEQQQLKMNLLNDALQSLTSEKKELLFLKFYSGLNNHQIGSMLGLKPDSVQKQINRILKKLQVNFIGRFLELFFLCFRA